MGNFALHTEEIILKASEIGIVFEKGFKEKIAEILSTPLQREKITIRYLNDEEEKVFNNLGKLVAEVYLKSELTKDREVVDISPLVDFNRGNYPLGDYRNADFFVLLKDRLTKDEKLIFVELTKEGDLLKEDAKGIKYNPSEVSLSITENISFEAYFKQVFENAKTLYKSLPVKAYGELKKLLQVLIYSADYLLKNRRKVKDLSLFVIYPVKDAFNVNFQYPVFTDEKLLEEAKEFLKNIRKHSCQTISVLPIAEDKLFKPLYDINEVRNRVGEFVRDKSKKGNAVVLLHAPSSGKTTATLNFVQDLAKDKPVFFCYFTTRIAISQKVAERLQDLGFEVLISDKSKYREKKRKYAKYIFLEKQGNLSLLKHQMLRLPKIPEKLAISTTFHSLVRTKYGKTTKHLTAMMKIFKQRYPNGEIVIGIDEILGMDTSFSSYRDLLTELKRENLINDTRIFVFDASLFSGKIFEEEYNLKVENPNRAIPPHLNLGRYQERYQSQIEGITHHFEFLPTYPAKTLRVKHREFLIDLRKSKKTEKMEEIAQALTSLLLKVGISEGVGLYMQNIHIINKVAEYLENRWNIDTQIIHTLSKPKIESVKNKVFLFTSALSRGVDLPVKHFFIVVPTFNIETNLAELLQVFYRLRDGKTDGLYDKEITLLYPLIIEEDTNLNFLRLKYRATKNLVENLLEAYINPNSEKEYKIPIPAIKENFFNTNLLSYIDKLRQIKTYASIKRLRVRFHFKIEGWTDYQIPKIHYPFAVFPKADLKIRIIINEEDYSNFLTLKDLLERDFSIPFETKIQLMEFLNGFSGRFYYLNTTSPFAIFLPNLIIPTYQFGRQLDEIKSITRLGYRIFPEKVLIDNKVVRKVFDVKHDYDLIGFFPNEVIGDFLNLPQIPLIFFAS